MLQNAKPPTMNEVYENFRKSTNFDEHAEAILAHLDKQYKQDEITVLNKIFFVC